MVGTTGANATGGGGGIWRKLVMFQFFCVGLDAQLRESMWNTLSYTPIQGGGLSSNFEGSITFVVRLVRQWRWCYSHWGKGGVVIEKGDKQQ